MPKLTKEEMAEAFELRERGVYLTNLATVYGVSENTLRRYFLHAEQVGFAMWDEEAKKPTPRGRQYRAHNTMRAVSVRHVQKLCG